MTAIPSPRQSFHELVADAVEHAVVERLPPLMKLTIMWGLAALFFGAFMVLNAPAR